MNMAAFGKKLREAWEASGLTQEKVVEGTDLNVRTFQRLMNGEGNPSLNTILGLCSSLMIDPVALLGEAQSPVADAPSLEGLIGFHQAASFFDTLAKAPREIQLLVLAVLYKDAKYLDLASPKFQRKTTALLRAVLDH